MSRLRMLRRTTQLAALVMVAILPILDIFRLDLPGSQIVVLGYHLWLREFLLVLVGWVWVMALLGVAAAVFGRGFCGWLCPQTLICEMANAILGPLRDLTKGKKGDVDLEMKAQRQLLRNPAAVLLLFTALAGGLILTSYFVPWSITWRELQGGHPSTSLLKAIAVGTVVIAGDLLILRHTICRFFCPYGWWQRLFWSKPALSIRFERARAGDCTKCGACWNACFMGLDPRVKELEKSCVNCGECISACRRQLVPMNKVELISFEHGWNLHGLLSFFQHLSLAGLWRPAALVVLLATTTSGLVWSVSARQPVYATMSGLSSLDKGSGGGLQGTFVVWLYNNTVAEQSVRLKADGLPAEAVDFGADTFQLSPGDVKKLTLRFALGRESIVPGPHRLELYVQDATTERLLAHTSAPFVFPPSLIGWLPGTEPGSLIP